MNTGTGFTKTVAFSVWLPTWVARWIGFQTWSALDLEFGLLKDICETRDQYADKESQTEP